MGQGASPNGDGAYGLGGGTKGQRMGAGDWRLGGQGFLSGRA